jgi:hypothetical protein
MVSLLLQTTGGFLVTVLAILLYLVALVVGIGSLVCFVMVVVQMFKHDQTGLGVACILLIFCGIGGLIAFIYGWIKNKEWGLQKIMLIWTACIIVGLLVNIVLVGVGASMGGNAPTQFQQQLDNMQIDDLNVELEPPTP